MPTTTMQARDVASSSDGDSLFRKPSRVQGPRPHNTRLSQSTFTVENHGPWTWAYQRADLPRGLSIYSHLSDSSNRPPSPSLSLSSSSRTLSSAIDHKSSIPCSHGSCQSRQKPAGPRAPHRTRRRPRKPVLRVDTSARLDESKLPQSAESFTDILRSHTPKIPPSLALSPNNYLLDWDAIFRVLGASYDVLQDG